MVRFMLPEKNDKSPYTKITGSIKVQIVNVFWKYSKISHNGRREIKLFNECSRFEEWDIYCTCHWVKHKYGE